MAYSNPWVLAGFAAFAAIALAVGTRLILLWWKSRQLPELLIGIGVLGIGPLGYGGLVAGDLLRPFHPSLATLLVAFGSFFASAGVVAKYAFNWRVYRPQSPGVGALFLACALSTMACLAYEAAIHGFSSVRHEGASYVPRAVLLVGALLWGSGEALRYWVKMRKRVRIGLASPLVANRFALWGCGAGSAGVGSMVVAIAVVHSGRPEAELPAVLVASSIFGLLAAVAMALAFIPPAAYRRWLSNRTASA